MTDQALGEQAIVQIEEYAGPFSDEQKSRLLFFARCVARGGPHGVASSYGYWLTKERHPRWAAVIQATYKKGELLAGEEFDEIIRKPWADLMRQVFPPHILEAKFPHLVESRSD